MHVVFCALCDSLAIGVNYTLVVCGGVSLAGALSTFVLTPYYTADTLDDLHADLRSHFRSVLYHAHHPLESTSAAIKSGGLHEHHDEHDDHHDPHELVDQHGQDEHDDHHDHHELVDQPGQEEQRASTV